MSRSLVPRTHITVSRARSVKADLSGDGRLIGTIRPREPRRQYVSVIVGDIPTNAVIHPEEVMEAMRSLVAIWDNRPTLGTDVEELG